MCMCAVKVCVEKTRRMPNTPSTNHPQPHSVEHETRDAINTFFFLAFFIRRLLLLLCVSGVGIV